MESACISSDLTGAWIFVALAREKGRDFAQTVVDSDLWAFPRMTLEQAVALLAAKGDHCHCPRCRPPTPRAPQQASPAAQPTLLDLMEAR